MSSKFGTRFVTSPNEILALQIDGLDVPRDFSYWGCPPEMHRWLTPANLRRLVRANLCKEISNTACKYPFPCRFRWFDAMRAPKHARGWVITREIVPSVATLQKFLAEMNNLARNYPPPCMFRYPHRIESSKPAREWVFTRGIDDFLA